MYFSRLRMREDAAKSRDFWEVASGPYQIHTMVWDLFADSSERKRDFLYRVDYIQRKPVVYTMSAREPVYSGGVWSLETKVFQPVLSEGQRLGFSLRANPVRTRWTQPDEEGKRKQKRHDVVMDAKKAIRESGVKQGDRPSMADLMQREGFKWLASRAEKHGFEVSEGEVMAEAYRQMKFGQDSKNRQVSISTIDFSGMLTIRDLGVFMDCLGGGIGPAKGFGCGMLMIRSLGR